MKNKQLNSLLAAFIALFLLVTGCTSSANESTTKSTPAAEITSGKKQAIEKELSALMKEFFQAAEKLDIEACMTFFENTPNFLAANPDGTAGDYNSLKKVNADAFSQMAALKFTPKKQVIRILSDSLALYTYFIKEDITLKTGEKMTYEDVAATMLFTKIKGTWKATFYQESELSPTLGK